MIRETIVPAIPDIRDDNLKDVLRAIKATIDVREGSIGDPLDQAVTLRDLTDLNLAVSGGSTSTLAGGLLPVSAMLAPVASGYNPATDFTTPPAPSGLRARGGFTNVYLEWDGAPYRNHGYTEIWRASVDALAQAAFVGTTAASLYADAAAPDATYFYWIRFVSAANVTGPYNQTSGTRATTAIDVSAALTALSSEIQSSQLFVDLGTRVGNIETDAYIQNLTSGALKSQLDQLSAGVTSANSQITSLRAVNSNQATLLTELSSTSGAKTRTFFQTTAPVSTLAYTLTVGDVWFDTDDNNKSYRWSGASWVVFAAAAKVYYQASAPTHTAATPLLVGDLWYDADDQNRPYRWDGTAWVELRDGFINARVTTLEQTKIGYATLNATGLVFDNNGAITDKATTDAWNLANPANPATWRVGLPFATAVKQVGVTDGNDTLTLEQRFTAQKTTNSTLFGQYTIKIDNKGHVTGFGLASGSVDGTPTSAFIVRADRFAVAGVNDVADPLGTLAPTRKPFIVLTTPTTVNGKVYPAGTWIDTAFIANATITNAQIENLTADKLTAGALSAALGMTTGKLWGGVAISANKDNGTFGELFYPFATANFGTGFFLGNDGGAYKFYVGSPTQNMNWNGSALTVTGTLNAVAGNFRNITVYDSQNRVILSSGGVPFSAVNGLGSIAALDQVPWTSISSRPTTLAALDATAAADLDGRTLTYYQNEPPTGTVNDLWFDTNDGNKLYRHNGSSWLVVQDAGIAAAAGLATTAQTTANSKITTYYSIAAPSSPAVGDLWYSTDTREIKRWSGSAWVVSGNYVNNTNQITDGAGLGQTANWIQVANRPTTLAALDATAANDLDGKTVTYYQAAAPAGTVNDLWFDTDDGNKLYRHNGTSWLAVQDAGIAAAAGLATQAQTTANSKITTYYTTTAPTTPSVGDLWYNATTKLLQRWNGSAWVTSGNYVDNTNQLTDGARLGETALWTSVANRPTTLAALDATAATDLDGKTITYYQATAPAGTVNDLWFDTDDGNKLYRHNGTNWVVVQDAGIAAAAGLASTAQTTANSKITTYYATTAPTAPALGDLWYNASTRELKRWSGIAWVTSGNYVDNTNQITDGAGLGTTALWPNVSGDGRPADNATRNQVNSGLLANRPSGQDGDFYYATDVSSLYQKIAGSWVLSSTVGAPAGTLVNGVAVSTITGAITNFNNSNDRDGAAITAPTIAGNGTAVDHTLQTNGSADISFEWTWSGTEGDIDGFQVYVYQSAANTAYAFGTTPAEEMVYEIPAAKRAFILFGVVPDRYYTFGVRAYRIVDSDVNAAGVITSNTVKPTAAGENPYQPSVQVAFAGNVTGTVSNVAAGTLTDNAANGASAWSKFTGAGNTLPSGNVEFNFAGAGSKGGNAINTDNVGAQTAAVVASATSNFNSRNDRKNTTPANPTIAGDGTAVDHVINTDGAADISLDWAFGGTGDAYDIDGFLVYIRQGSTATAYTFGASPAEEVVYTVPADKRAFILYGVPADKYYTLGVRAYRIVDQDVVAGGIAQSAIVKATGAGENPYQPASSVAFAGNVTGTVLGNPASTLTTAATNFNGRNDRSAATVVDPTLANAAGTVDHTLNTDGSADISLEWVWSGTEADIDGFIVFVHDNGTTTPTARRVIDGAANAAETVFYVTPQRRAFILQGVAANHWYTFGVQAYRIVDPDIDATGVKKSAIAQPLAAATETTFGAYQPSSNVAFAGNVTGTINGIITAANVNAWEYISGTGKPADGATRNTVYRQSTAPTGASVNDIWFNTSNAAVSYWNGSSWILAGDVTAQNTAANIAGQGALATQSSVFVGSTVKFADGSTMNTGDFVNRLTKIGTGNISTFVSDAAIGNAYIGDLNAAKITAGFINADRIAAGSLTAAKINTSGLEIKDSKGNVILRSGSTPINSVPTFSVVRRWDFDGATVLANTVPGFPVYYTVDGFGSNQINFSVSGSYLTLTPTGTDPQLYTPDELNIDGALYSKIQVRIKRTGGTGWDGLCIYKTSTRPLNATGYKYASNGTLLNEWVTLEWDMANLDGGGNDWTTSTIEQIRLDFGLSAADTFEIDWIAIGRYSSAPVHQITPENASTFIKDLAVDTLQIAGNAVTIPLTYENPYTYSATGTVLTYDFQMPSGGKVIVLWQGQTDSARWFFFRIYLNTLPGSGVAAGYDYVGYPNGDYEYDSEYSVYTYVGEGSGSYLYRPASAAVPDIGNTRTGGAFEDAPTAIGFGTAVAGNNTVRIYWERDQGTLTYQRLIILGAQR